MPPLQALVALHAFWVLALVPPLTWLLRRGSPRLLARVGTLLIAVGIVGIATIAAWQVVSWMPSVPAEYHRYLGQRVLFVLATSSDLPLVQVSLAGLVCAVVARTKRARSRSKTRIPFTNDSDPFLPRG